MRFFHFLVRLSLIHFLQTLEKTSLFVVVTVVLNLTELARRRSGPPTFGGEPCWRRRPTPREVNGVKGIHPSDRPASLPLRCGRLAGAREGGRVSSCVNAKYYGQVRFGLVLVDPARHSVAALAVVCSRSLKYRVVRVLAKEDHLRVVMDGAKTLRWARRLQRTAAWLT